MSRTIGKTTSKQLPLAEYKVDDSFETANGTLYVSKPYRSRTSKKLRAVVSFVPRSSAFDINNESSNKNEFRVSFLYRCFYLLGLIKPQNSSRASSLSSGCPPLSLQCRAMCKASRPMDVLLTLALQLCSPKTPSQWLSVMVSSLSALVSVSCSPKQWRRGG